MINLHDYLHNYTYSTKRVAKLRVQAEGRIALRRLQYILVLSWAVPVVTWLNSQLQDVSEVRGEDGD